eukprot:CAMPEP_0115759994 /NCGR_PEP_ID=MMETSP0272-20121206/99765_1 /TAXON_ID=71861 /ORGANISM="Scrippsiella trochoidea, Strain CCMP3099" /LENGTH=312 /DNA_ID=CAMNT_0003205635 /DNA_START=158 /DNA_END=1095 /DNA_ORIENTATION=-
MAASGFQQPLRSACVGEALCAEAGTCSSCLQVPHKSPAAWHPPPPMPAEGAMVAAAVVEANEEAARGNQRCWMRKASAKQKPAPRRETPAPKNAALLARSPLPILASPPKATSRKVLRAAGVQKKAADAVQAPAVAAVARTASCKPCWATGRPKLDNNASNKWVRTTGLKAGTRAKSLLSSAFPRSNSRMPAADNGVEPPTAAATASGGVAWTTPLLKTASKNSGSNPRTTAWTSASDLSPYGDTFWHSMRMRPQRRNMLESSDSSLSKSKGVRRSNVSWTLFGNSLTRPSLCDTAASTRKKKPAATAKKYG